MSDEPKSAADAGPPPVWPALAKLDPARLGSVLSGEHPQTAAVVLSKLPPPTAANVMVTLEKSFRADVIRRMMAIATVPDRVARSAMARAWRAASSRFRIEMSSVCA